MKIVIVTFSVGVAAFGFVPEVSAAGFPDVPPTHANHEAILYVQSQGIVQGYPDGTYKPDKTINRAEFTKIIIGAIASEEELRSCDPSILEYLSDIVIKTFRLIEPAVSLTGAAEDSMVVT